MELRDINVSLNIALTSSGYLDYFKILHKAPESFAQLSLICPLSVIFWAWWTESQTFQMETGPLRVTEKLKAPVSELQLFGGEAVDF